MERENRSFLKNRPQPNLLRRATYFRDVTRDRLSEWCRLPFAFGSGSMPNFTASAAILRRHRMTEVCESLNRAAISRRPNPSARQFSSWRSRGVSHSVSKEMISRALTCAGTESPDKGSLAEIPSHSAAVVVEQRAW